VTTRERWAQVHELLGQGVGLLECARRLNLALNTVKRYARVPEPERLVRAPKYRPTLVDPYRDHLRRRRAEEPAVPVQRLYAEIKQLGYQGSLNLLYRYITQGRAEGDRPPTSPRRFASLLLTRPENLTDSQRKLCHQLTAACPEMIETAGFVHSFAAFLTPDEDNAGRLEEWTAAVRAADLPHLHAFTRGLDFDKQAVHAALTLPYHNGGTEGVNTKTKRIMRQMHGRAGFALLRHRILLGLHNALSPPEVRQSRWRDRPARYAGLGYCCGQLRMVLGGLGQLLRFGCPSGGSRGVRRMPSPAPTAAGALGSGPRWAGR
jgi:hypothetical protein